MRMPPFGAALLSGAAVITVIAAPASAVGDPGTQDIRDVCPTQTTPAADYTDLASTSAPHAVSCVAAYQVIVPIPGEAFHPTARVPRGDLAVMLYRLGGDVLGVDWDITPTGLSDAERLGERAEAVYAMINAGISNGYPDGAFHPDIPVDRGQLAAFLVRFQDFVTDGRTPYITPPGVGTFFYDTEGYYEQEASALYYGGIARGPGDADGVAGGLPYRPHQNVTRQQMAQFLARVLASEVHRRLDLHPWFRLPGEDFTGQVANAPELTTVGREAIRVAPDARAEISFVLPEPERQGRFTLRLFADTDGQVTLRNQDFAFTRAPDGTADPGSVRATFLRVNGQAQPAGVRSLTGLQPRAGFVTATIEGGGVPEKVVAVLFRSDGDGLRLDGIRRPQPDEDYAVGPAVFFGIPNPRSA